MGEEGFLRGVDAGAVVGEDAGVGDYDVDGIDVVFSLQGLDGGGGGGGRAGVVGENDELAVYGRWERCEGLGGLAGGVAVQGDDCGRWAAE